MEVDGNFRKILQNSLIDNGIDYTLKTNQEIMSIIENTEEHEVLIHATDIERLIREHQFLMELVTTLVFALKIDGKKDLANEQLIHTCKTALSLYK